MTADFQTISDLLRGRRVGKGREGVVVERECWVFVGARNHDGYGIIQRSSFKGKAHRYVYVQLVGEVPAGLNVLHTCDNRACVRPEHLWVGTQADNVRDMVAKGRANLAGLRARNDAARVLAKAKTKGEK